MPVVISSCFPACWVRDITTLLTNGKGGQAQARASPGVDARTVFLLHSACCGKISGLRRKSGLLLSPVAAIHFLKRLREH
ncbi:MAG: hypothetical protein LBO79_01495, partial [Zoogloeaceae bacterium]|nr:hypothetical protein [Zoogloeaceae bacterium]